MNFLYKNLEASLTSLTTISYYFLNVNKFFSFFYNATTLLKKAKYVFVKNKIYNFMD